jgi:hypothetical protein
MANVFSSNVKLNLGNNYSASAPVTTFSMDSTAPSVPFTPIASLGNLGINNYNPANLAYNPSGASSLASTSASVVAPPATRPYIWKKSS